MDSDSDDKNDDDNTSNHGNEGELIDIALATTAFGEKNPWMLPPSVKKVSQFSRPKQIVNKDNIVEDKNSDTDEDDVRGNVGATNRNNEVDIDELFDEIQKKRKLLPKNVQHEAEEDEEGTKEEEKVTKKKL